jgi:amphiphysin
MINQLSSLVSQRLKTADSAVRATSHDIDWNGLKRTPQKLRLKVIKDGSNTVDEMFDTLELEFSFLKQSINQLIKYSQKFQSAFIATLETSQEIGKSLTKFFDPYNNFRPEEQCNDGFILWEVIHRYLEDIRSTQSEISKDLEETFQIISTKLNELLVLVKVIQKRINARTHSLLDYDKVYNNHEQLVTKEQTSGLTVKQSQQIFNLERKLKENKLKYDEINDVLKTELPYFFKLVGLFMSSLQQIIFYKQLTIYYQANLKLQPLREMLGSQTVPDKTFNHSTTALISNFDVKLTASLFTEKLLNDFKSKYDPAADMIDKLSIVNFRETFLNELTGTSQQNYPFCEAIFSFNAQEKGDISIEVGDIIKILDKRSGWWKGELNGRIGMFPSNYVKQS